MTPAQRDCAEMIVDLFGEETPRIYPYDEGIKCTIPYGRMATTDQDMLTRVVVVAHDRCIRVQLDRGGATGVGLVLHKREGRPGLSLPGKDHPSMEFAMSTIREQMQCLESDQL